MNNGYMEAKSGRRKTSQHIATLVRVKDGASRPGLGVVVKMLKIGLVLEV